MKRHKKHKKHLILILEMSLQYLHSKSFFHNLFCMFPNWTVDGTHYEFHKKWLY
jgi:hypothetical protein